MTHICFQYGYAFLQWSKVLTVVILKIAESIRTYKLRTILLLEYYSNFSDKIYFGSILMKGVENSGFLPQEQHGGRSEHTLIQVAVLRSIFFEYIIHTRSNAALVLYDAENFNDCVAHNFASLTDQDFDMISPAINLCLKEIKEM